MKKILLLITAIFYSYICFAQFHDNTSIFGFEGASLTTYTKEPYDSTDNIQLTFSGGNIRVLPKKYIGIHEIFLNNAPYSDKNGNFSFLSLGDDAYNKKFKPIDPKNPLIAKPVLNGGNAAPEQLNLAMPSPRDDAFATLIYSDLYFGKIKNAVFDSTSMTFTDSTYTTHLNLYAAEIELNGENGLAKYIYQGKVIIKDTLTGKFTATRHANGRDWWIIAPRFGFYDTYYVLLLDKQGLSVHHKQKFNFTVEQGVGTAVFSPDGKYYVITEATNFYTNGKISIFNFDRCSGELKFKEQILTPACFCNNVAIAPNSRYMYGTEITKAFQYDLYAPSVAKSKKLIATYDGVLSLGKNQANFYRMQLMPDRRIYCTSFGFASEYFHIIENPNILGVGCNFKQRYLKLPARNIGSVPNFPNYRLGPIDGSPCDTLGINNEPRAWYRYEKDTTNKLKVEFTDLSFYEPKEWLWDFGDGSPIKKDTSPIHTFPKNGMYNVCLTVKNIYGSHTHCKTINFGTTATQEADNQSIVQVTPNPFRETLYVALSEIVAQPVLHLYDATGKNVANKLLYYGITEIDTQNLSAGFYLYNITSGSEMIAKGKVVKVE